MLSFMRKSIVSDSKQLNLDVGESEGKLPEHIICLSGSFLDCELAVSKQQGALHPFLHPTGCNRPLYHNGPD